MTDRNGFKSKGNWIQFELAGSSSHRGSTVYKVHREICRFSL